MTTSNFEILLQNSSPETLVKMMVDQLRAIETKKTNNWQLEAMFSDMFDELVYKLSSADEEEIRKIDWLLSSGADEEEIRKIDGLLSSGTEHAFIKNALTKFYKQNYETLEKAAEKLASVVYEERKELLHEAGENDQMDHYGTSGAKIELDRHSYINILDGKAPKIQHVYNDSKEQTSLNYSTGNALHDFWKNMNPEKISNINLLSDNDEDVFSDDEVKENSVAPIDKNWMQYKYKVMQGIKALSKPEASVLFQEENPIASFFKDMVNEVCNKIGVSPPFSQYQTQRHFKETIDKIRNNIDLKESCENNDQLNQPNKHHP